MKQEDNGFPKHSDAMPSQALPRSAQHRKAVHRLAQSSKEPPKRVGSEIKTRTEF